MSEIDYIIPGISVKQKAVIDLQELCEAIKEWLKQYKYLVFEKEYKDVAAEAGKELHIKLLGERKIDDYTKFVIEIKIKTQEIIEVYVKRKKLTKGEVNIKLESYLIKDYENIWEDKPFAKFLRGIYDKFILSGKFSRYADELTEETYKLHSEIKRFLNALIVEI